MISSKPEPTPEPITSESVPPAPPSIETMTYFVTTTSVCDIPDCLTTSFQPEPSKPAEPTPSPPPSPSEPAEPQFSGTVPPQANAAVPIVTAPLLALIPVIALFL